MSVNDIFRIHYEPDEAVVHKAQDGPAKNLCNVRCMPDNTNHNTATTSGECFYLRLPRSGTYDSLFGLSRSTWNNLILPCKANGFKPPIRSISVKQRHAVRGCRLIVVESAMEYFAKLEAEQSQAETTQHVPFDPCVVNNGRAADTKTLFGDEHVLEPSKNVTRTVSGGVQ